MNPDLNNPHSCHEKATKSRFSARNQALLHIRNARNAVMFLPLIRAVVAVNISHVFRPVKIIKLE